MTPSQALECEIGEISKAIIKYKFDEDKEERLIRKHCKLALSSVCQTWRGRRASQTQLTLSSLTFQTKRTRKHLNINLP